VLQMTRPPKHPKTGTYILRLAIPVRRGEACKQFHGVSRELRGNLGTKDTREARKRAADALVKLQGMLQQAARFASEATAPAHTFTPIDRDFIINWAHKALLAERFRLLPGQVYCDGRVLPAAGLFSWTSETKWIDITRFRGDGHADYRLSATPTTFELRELRPADPGKRAKVSRASGIPALLWSLHVTPYAGQRWTRSRVNYANAQAEQRWGYQSPSTLGSDKERRFTARMKAAWAATRAGT
jgi:hypothetical protein